jgi:hypothetical protein
LLNAAEPLEQAMLFFGTRAPVGRRSRAFPRSVGSEAHGVYSMIGQLAGPFCCWKLANGYAMSMFAEQPVAVHSLNVTIDA